MGNAGKRKAREKRVKKQLALARHNSKREPSPPRQARVKYDSPRTLAVCGPLLKASWAVSAALTDHLTQNGQPVPRPVVGFMLIDTGATKRCMALDVAQELGLQAIRIEKSYGAQGLQENEVFHARLQVGFAGPAGNRLDVWAERDAIGVKDLGNFMASLQLTHGDDFPNRLIGLLGRDWLMHGTLLYEGSKGSFEFKVDLSSLNVLQPGSERHPSQPDH